MLYVSYPLFWLFLCHLGWWRVGALQNSSRYHDRGLSGVNLEERSLDSHQEKPWGEQIPSIFKYYTTFNL